MTWGVVVSWMVVVWGYPKCDALLTCGMAGESMTSSMTSDPAAWVSVHTVRQIDGQYDDSRLLVDCTEVLAQATWFAAYAVFHLG